jgi:hypothetical protein
VRVRPKLRSTGTAIHMHAHHPPSSLHSPLSDDIQQARVTKLTLISIFMTIMATFASRKVQREAGQIVKPFDLLMLGLSSFRIGRMIAFEGIAAPLREPFTRSVEDASGAGKTVVARGQGARHAIGELMSCPICAGTWVSAALVYGLHLLPGPTRLLLTIMSVTGVAQLCYSTTEALEWTARAARQRCG